MDAFEEPTGGLLSSLGITDVDSGLDKAHQSLRTMWSECGPAASGLDAVSREAVMFLGMVGRAQGFHEGTAHGIRAGNPYTSFALLRSLAENAAAVAYLSDKPEALHRFMGDGHPVKVGTMTNHVQRYSNGFRRIYATLSDYTHPTDRSLLASHRVIDNPDGSAKLNWQSSPRFKSENDRLIACAWLVELTDAHSDLFVRLGKVLTWAQAKRLAGRAP